MQLYAAKCSFVLHPGGEELLAPDCGLHDLPSKGETVFIDEDEYLVHDLTWNVVSEYITDEENNQYGKYVRTLSVQVMLQEK